MPSFHRLTAVTAALAAAALVPAATAHAAPSASVHASPAQIGRLLFVAGDVRRLSRSPSGTVDTVLEQVLQAEYRADPGLDPSDAAADIDGLRRAVGNGATSPATLAVVAGNQRVLAILAAFEQAQSAPRVKRALASVADRALTESSSPTFDTSADTRATLLYGSFSPAATLRATAGLAAADPAFGRARDRLWAAASQESVFSDPSALVAGDPDLQTDAIRDLLARRAPDGSLTASVDDLEGLARDGLRAVDAQTTTALDDHAQVVRTCPGQFCDAYRDRAKADGAAARGAITDQQASLTAVSGLLAQADADLGRALQAEAQGAAQVASSVNAYYAATDYGEYVHLGSDVAGLVIGLAAVEVDPAAAITGVINVVGDIVGVSVQGPDANQLILDGLKGVSMQLSGFAQATAAQFRAVDARLEALTRQVSEVAQSLSTQLAEVRTQLGTLDDKLTTLQGSVDRLESEIQSLFAALANGSLRKVIDSSVGYSTRNTDTLSAEAFGRAADEIFSNATTIASGPDVAAPAGPLTAVTAAGITGLDAHLNFFSAFAGGPLDNAGSPWPGALGGALPDPGYWATAARAYAQLLLENRAHVVAGRLTEQLDGIVKQGTGLGAALAKIDLHDDGDRGTGNRLLNAALDYYGSWVDGDRAGVPALLPALRAERAHFLSLEPGLTDPGRNVDLYGGAAQAPGDVSGLDAFKRLASFVNAQITLPTTDPAPALVTGIPAPIRNALRLNVGSLKVNWDATFQGDIQRNQRGPLYVEFSYLYTDPDGKLYPLDTLRVTIPNAVNCVGNGDYLDGVRTVQASWAFDAPGSCPEVAYAVQQEAVHRAGNADATAAAHVTPLVEDKLRTLQAGFYADLVGPPEHPGPLAGGVADAAQRLGGAQKLIDGYVTLGLPQALATDDALHGLIAGDAANALAHPFFDDRTAAPAATVPDRVASFLRFVQGEMPQGDPLNALGILLNRHRLALQDAIAPYIKSRHGAVDMGPLDETSPLVQSTLDRLALTRAVLEDHIAHPPAAPQPTASQPRPAVVPAAAPPAPGTRPAARPRARLIRAPRVHGRTIRLTVGCQAGTCRLTATAVSGRRAVARRVRLTLRHGARRTVVLRLNAAGRRLLARHGHLRVTVKVTLGGRTLRMARVTVR
jgi:hypothetical protein